VIVPDCRYGIRFLRDSEDEELDMKRSGVRLRTVIGVAALMAMLVLVLAGCGSSKSSTSSSSSAAASTGSGTTPAAAKPTKSAIKTMTIASVNYNGPTYQNILETAQMYAKYVNAHGGIAGHPLIALTCDEQGIPSGTATCAHKAVSAGVVADVGSFSYNDGTAIPIYAAANTAWFGSCCQISPAAYQSKDSFPLGNNPALNAGGLAAAAAQGCKHIGLLELDLPSTPQLNVLFANAAKANGYTGTIKYVKVPLTSQDLTAQVTEATSGTDCISMYLSENNISAVMQAFASTPHTQRLYGPQGNFDSVSVKGFESLVTNDIVYGTYSDLSSPAYADYRSAIATYNPPSNLDYDSLGGLGAWAAMRAFTNIVESMKGPINNTTFLAAVKQASNVTTGGELAPINFTKEYTGLKGQFPRSFNLNETYLKNPADPHQLGGFINLTKSIEGVPDAAVTQALKGAQ
jgi:branched-chain amino acid transport system substrate-binding protein